MTANPAPGFLQMQPMNGQWVGRFAGTNSGLLIIDLDGMGAHYEGRACAYDDNQSSILLITLLGFTQNAQPVPGKTSDSSGKADEQVQRESKEDQKKTTSPPVLQKEKDKAEAANTSGNKPSADNYPKNACSCQIFCHGSEYR